MALDLCFEAPLINVELELEIFIKHLGHRSFIALHLLEKFMLFLDQFVLNKLLLQLDKALSIVVNLFFCDSFLLLLKHTLVVIFVLIALSTILLLWILAHVV